MGSFKVIIIGSGLSGSLLANGLANHGIDFLVYERDSCDTKREGYQIRVGENALIGMRACLRVEHLAQVVENIGPNAKVPIIYDKTFQQMLDLNRLPAYSKSVPIDRVALREVLAGPILKLGKLHYDKKFVGCQIIKEEQKELVRVFFEDGSADTCDLLIGADGNRSKVNEMLGVNNIKAVEGFRALLTKCDLPLSLYNTVDKEVLSSPIATLQDGKLMYFCAYLPADYAAKREAGQSSNPNEDLSSCMLSLCWPENLSPPLDTMSLDQRWGAIADIYKDWSPKHHQILELCRGQEMFILSPRVGIKPTENWRKEVATASKGAAGSPHVWLMGDALHPMLPNRGMGGQQAMHDAADVLPLIRKLAAKASTPQGLQPEDFQTACDTYEKGMIPRAFEWVRKSGGDNFVPVDLSKTLDRLLLGMFSHIIPAARLGYWLLSFFTDTSGRRDAPEFAS
ncbi:hypothetical protein JX265_000795 [Neoarthrinium moseri]|uniref:FAD-binding domain-containing protein n=1 Tax=Neoarthrinium moseri TaxID=1658444 RepID=A0A9Q0AUK0_9PEZI|nr:uncharacterized protein JN550_007099 [Neoarthrinium moseri]KAI1847544.1 hypothetical protein JX266_006396 [Neoarthrinium moseri]KAI1867368.1 hypothetical protein JN550_007099 [Neoarthrinium moseri]KAI1880555.1 hypothetical protein JX265_000795 [Neoarthrinium moseri]